MWTSNKPALVQWSGGEVIVDEVLYALDGPAIFTADVGLTKFLFYKIEEQDDSDLFLIADTTAQIVSALKEGQLSLWGALHRENKWVLELTSGFDVRRYWLVTSNELPPNYLPPKGLALFPTASPVADTLEQAFSFFSMKFISPDLHEGTIPLSRFKALIDNAYESIKKIFPAPAVGDDVLFRGYDFNMFEPKFGSLIIALNEPFLDLKGVRKSLREKLASADFRGFFEDHRGEFFDNVRDVVGEAQRGDLKRSTASQHFDVLSQINDLLPTEDNEIEQIEFRSTATPVVTINNEVGTRLRRGFRLAEREPRTIVGVVVEANWDSGTFVIRNRDDRQITCVATLESGAAPELKRGQKVKVHGNFLRRKRRDKMLLKVAPDLI